MRSLSHDGVALFYEEVDGGEPTVLLVHGWCCDHSYLDPQMEHLTGLGSRVVAQRV